VPPRPLDPVEAYAARDAIRGLLRDDAERAAFHDTLDELRAEASDFARDLEVVIITDRDGTKKESIRRDPLTGALELTRWDEGTPVRRRVVIPGPFRARAVADDGGARMLAFAGLGDGGEEFRDYADAAVSWLARRFALTGGDRHAAALFLAAIPTTGHVSSRLALVLRDGEHVRVDRPFVASTGGRGTAAAIVNAWYRPRPRERALAGLEKLKTFMVTANAKLRLQYVTGAPIFGALFPDSILPSLIETGAAGSGKTLGERATVAVLWGLSAGDGETLTRDVLGSAFRSSAFSDATNLPLIVDEAQAGSRAERERHRATASGGVATRGGTDLRLRTYRHRAPLIRNGNASDDTVELTDSEAGGEGRRQIRVSYGLADADAIAPKRAEFQRFVADLAIGPTDESGGGAAVWLLRDRIAEDPGFFDRLRRLAADAPDERHAVVAIGAELLGEPAARVPEPPAPESGEAFLEWLQARVAEWFAERGAGKIPRAIGTMRPLVEASPLSDPEGIEQQRRTRFVAVSRETLREYREALRRGGRESPFSALSDLEALCGLTGQTADAMLGKVEAGRTARRGVLVKLPKTAPAAVRCAIVQLPPTDEEGDEADEKKDDAEGKKDETEGDAARKRERDSDAHRPEGEGYEGYGRVTNTIPRDTERERDTVTLVTPVTPVYTTASEGAEKNPRGGVHATARVTNPPADVKSGNPREGYGQGYGLPGGGNTPPSPPRAADPPRPDPGRLEAATRELADLVRSVGTADRDVIHRVLGANYSPAEISSAIGSVCASGLVRQEPNGSLSWKEAGP
jgi:hypothetical protein